jgi:NADH-quinone oxidoreductase subunit J
MVEFFTILALLASFGAFGSFSAHTNIYFMILSFLSSGIVYYLLSATYMAIMLFIVYVGAVAMLFVFCVMLLNLSSKFTRISSFTF